MSKQVSVISIQLNDQNIIDLVNGIASSGDVDAKIFTTNCSVVTQAQKRLTILPIYEAKYYKGKALVFDLMTLELCCEFPNLEKILYYQNETLPWTVFRQNQYSFWNNFFDNPKIEVFTTNKEVYNVLSLLWKPPKLINNISSQSMGDLINEL